MRSHVRFEPVCTSAGRMASDDEQAIPEAQLEHWYVLHDGCDSDGGAAGIGIQARDKLIRKLIAEVRRLRQR